MSDEADSDEDIRKQTILDDDSVKRVAIEGIDQVDRILDRINLVEKTIEDNNHQLSRNEEKIKEMRSKLKQIENKQNQIEDKVNDMESLLDNELKSVQTQLDTISKNTGLRFPSQIRTKITIPIVVTLLAFSLFSGGIAIISGNDIPLRAQLSTAGTLGLLALETIEYMR